MKALVASRDARSILCTLLPLAFLRSELHGPYDAVIIAAPLESASITFQPPAAASGASSLGTAGSLHQQQEEGQAQGQGQGQALEQGQGQGREQRKEEQGNAQQAGGRTEQGGRSVARVCRWLRCVPPAAGHTTDGENVDGEITDGAGAGQGDEGQSGGDAADGASVGGAGSASAAGQEQGKDVGEEGALAAGLEGAGSRRLSLAGQADAVQMMKVAQAARMGEAAGSEAAGQLSGRRYQQTVRGGGVLRLGVGLMCAAAGCLPLHSLSNNTTLRHRHHQA